MCVPVFTPETPKTPTIIPQTKEPTIDENARSKRAEDRSRATAAKGRQSTLLTSGEGLNSRLNIARKKLLGE